VSEPIATWNSARGVWETPTLNLLCGHLEPFSQTWPKSGSMRNGSVFPRPAPVPAISAGAYSSSRGLLPTPRVSGGSDIMTPAPSTLAGKHGDDLGPAIGALLPTPRASARENRQTKRTPSQEAGTHGLCLAAEVLELLPAPGEPGRGADDPEPVTLLPTPRATDGTKGGPNQRGSSGDLMLPSAVVSLPPSPCAADNSRGHRSRSAARSGELLLPGITQELSAATRKPSGDTSASSDAPHQRR
jgi:hypothetical protein